MAGCGRRGPQAGQHDPPVARVLPIMLATRLVPEMEAQQAAHLAAHREGAGAAPVETQYYRLVVPLWRRSPCCARTPLAPRLLHAWPRCCLLPQN